MRVWPLPVPGGGDEVEAGMDACVRNHLLPINAHLLVEVLVKLLVDILQDRGPAEEEGGGAS